MWHIKDKLPNFNQSSDCIRLRIPISYYSRHKLQQVTFHNDKLHVLMTNHFLKTSPIT